jgi:hypothetical protein
LSRTRTGSGTTFRNVDEPGLTDSPLWRYRLSLDSHVNDTIAETASVQSFQSGARVLLIQTDKADAAASAGHDISRQSDGSHGTVG